MFKKFYRMLLQIKIYFKINFHPYVYFLKSFSLSIIFVLLMYIGFLNYQFGQKGETYQ